MPDATRIGQRGRRGDLAGKGDVENQRENRAQRRDTRVHAARVVVAFVWRYVPKPETTMRSIFTAKAMIQLATTDPWATSA